MLNVRGFRFGVQGDHGVWGLGLAKGSTTNSRGPAKKDVGVTAGRGCKVRGAHLNLQFRVSGS